VKEEKIKEKMVVGTFIQSGRNHNQDVHKDEPDYSVVPIFNKTNKSFK
jgi:hypothetical protein